jgi:hypothetical protein
MAGRSARQLRHLLDNAWIRLLLQRPQPHQLTVALMESGVLDDFVLSAGTESPVFILSGTNWVLQGIARFQTTSSPTTAQAARPRAQYTVYGMCSMPRCSWFGL